MHDDVTQSDCIIEMAGFLLARRHHRIRNPQRKHFVNANLREEELQDKMFWSDLSDEGVTEN